MEKKDPLKFKNKYRIASTRLQNWDYRWAAAYFITICTKNRTCYFGDIVNGKMVLSNVGVLANVFLFEIKNHAKNVELGEFVIMPNHVHLILILNGNDTDMTDLPVVEARHALPLQSANPPEPETIGQKRFQNQGKNSVSSIIGSYKSAVTRHANRLGFEFAWQPRFYDHIIRNEKSFINISNYIINNPLKWNEDKFHS
ncbi:MAG TPA: transposase [Saprospiraceae bacterium]|nr:transposase [Saprospiraceae bacterium]